MVGLSPRALGHEIQAHAIWSAGRVRDLLAGIGSKPFAVMDSGALETQLNSVALACHAQPVADGIPLAGRIARMQDASWWTKNVRRELLRVNEAEEHAAGAIRRKGQVYVSDHASQVKRMRRRANRATLENLEVCNEEGQAFNLAEVSDASVSNPAIRRAELMMRCRGFEETAAFMGHVAHFLTITCPSRFHRFRAGLSNPKWDGSTPKDGQTYLCGIWKKIRAAWKYRGFMPYGFRVAEPHHDGCPHWHILLFMPVEHAGWFKPLRFVGGRKDHGTGVIGVAGRYAMADSQGEIGYTNTNARFDAKRIDPAEGSATGYIAKYICKNIDGMREDGDAMGLDYDSGTEATQASQRVRDWASVWGNRQFQQIGGPSVTVWRELRRMREEIVQPLQAAFDWETVRSAADRSLWSLFWVLQGGPEVAKSKLAMRPEYNAEGVGKYGDEVKRVVGIVAACEGGEVMLRTRMHEWCIQRAGTAATLAADYEQKEWMHTNKRVQEFERAAGLPVRSDVRFPLAFGAADGPWTRVNNCRKGFENGDATGADDDAGQGDGGGEGMEYGPGTRQGDGRRLCAAPGRGAGGA